jgi:hypothetical protein
MLSAVQRWTGVPGGQESWTHYLVLGIARDEQDPTVIEEAALDRAAIVRAYQLTHGIECSRLLDQIARALVTLLDPSMRREYDAGCSDVSRDERSKPRPPTPSPRPIRGGEVGGEGAAPAPCDVMLVCRGSAPRQPNCRAR